MTGGEGMKILILQGSPNRRGSTYLLADSFRQGAESAGHTVEIVDAARADVRSAIADEVENFEEYDRVFIGHPIWWGDAPRIVQTFLESYPFADKRVYTFSTSGSSSGNGAYNGLREGYPEINFAGNLHFTSSRLSSAQARVADRLSEILSAEAA